MVKIKKRGNGTYNQRKIASILKKNGYYIKSVKNHIIYTNDNGDIISIPRRCKDSVLKREFKNHNIKENI